ncbi:YIP1 family protein [Methanoculleus sp.]|uniref:YIP1 family protein n=1 Tax=Methanoculleus sp. TaxID=90427 RepID=UPI00320CFCEB
MRGTIVMNTGSIRVLLDPGRFFEERMQDEPGLKIPALIVLVYGLISAVAAALAVNMVIAILPAEAQAFGAIGVAFAVVGAVIMGFLAWIFCAAVFYIFSMLFKGKGSFTRTLEFTGYGLLPQIFGGIIGTAFSYQVISNLTIPPVTNPEQIAEISESLAGIIAADPLTQIAGLLGILFILWSANIWIFGMRYARNLSTRDAALTVGIPVALYIAYTLITLVGWL